MVRASGARRHNRNNARKVSLISQLSIDSAQLDDEVFGSSEMLLPALVHVPSLAATDSAVLITGEAGTGTELVAKAIHRLSYRSSQAFVRINCATIPPQPISSELFDRLKDSWSQATQPRLDCGRPVKGGTLLLEGVGGLSVEAQIVLLRFLHGMESQPDCEQKDPSNVRLIGTTTCDLRAAVAEGSFLQDLLDRFNGSAIEVPPLRGRKADIPVLVRYFLNRCAIGAGKTFPPLTKSTIDLLQSYAWPGNIPELQRMMERFAELSVAGASEECFESLNKTIREAFEREMASR